mmetsp:Transcript_26798/g.67523  ORF Transcript_26798/g.67523 Transcript_26798/m.67523 type:complete len:134 (-) Transcript_26798:540-941(-)
MVIPKLVLPLRKALAVCSLGGVVFAEQHPPHTVAMTVDPDAHTDVEPDEAATRSDAAFIVTGLEKNSEKKKMEEKSTREKKKANTKNKNKKMKETCAECRNNCDHAGGAGDLGNCYQGCADTHSNCELPPHPK